MSDDGRFTLVVIALLGNPFSAAYARARARRDSRPLDHCSLHVALYGPRGRRWSLRERALTDGDRGPGRLAMGASLLSWEGGTLRIAVDESTTPGGRPIRGRITVAPQLASARAVDLDAAGSHAWWPVAPLARVEVDLSEPEVRFAGHGYHDANAGTSPLDETFAHWSWTRARLGKDLALVGYDAVEKDRTACPLTLLFSSKGDQEVERFPRASLPATRWGLGRSVPVDQGVEPRVVERLDDGPCYARARVSTRVLGHDVTAVHEVLSGDRLARSWVRYLLGFRMGVAP